MTLRQILTTIIGICALHSGAQTLTATYVEYADSADRYIKQERWADAERIIIKALKHEPANKSNYLLWSNLGTVRTHQENYDGAIEAFDIGLASAPRSTTLLSNRARAYVAKGNVEEAKKDLDQTLEIDSTLQWPRKMRGLLRMMSGNKEGARDDFRIYTQSFGRDAAVSEAEGDILASERRLVEASDKYREAYGIEPTADLMVRAAVCAYEAGKLDDMEEDLAQAIHDYPRNGDLYLMRAMLNRTRYQQAAMEADLKMARDLGADRTLYKHLTADLKKN